MDEIEYLVMFNGYYWTVTVDGEEIAQGETPTSAMIAAEGKTLRKHAVKK